MTAKFQFIDYLITKSIFVRKSFAKSNEFDIDIQPKAIINEIKQKFQLTLEIKVTDKQENYLINIEAVGLFKFEGTIKENQDFLYLNAPAILFPYIRAYISSMTAISGMNTITIPAMNLSRLKEQLKSNTEDLTPKKIVKKAKGK